MNILITGGTGLIGSAFIESATDCQFTVLTRSTAGAKSTLPSSVTCIESLSALPHLNEFDAVINLAGEPIVDKRWSEEQKNIICQSRWEITQQLVDLFAKSATPPSVFLSGSAIGVYGNRGDESLTEKSSVSERDFPTRLCIRWESIARQAEPYTRVVLLRTGIVLAKQGGALAKMLLPFKLCLGGPIGSGQQYMAWIHYRDHIAAMHFLLKDKGISGPVNLVAPNAEKNKEFTQTLAKSLRRIAIFPMPRFVLHALLGESSSLLLDSQKVVPQTLLNRGFSFEFNKLKSALIDLLN
ncbi:TIGR01777 family oxidoreductase [Zhongshania aquimaris]|uniref:TIGR01777 family oxidoreductase n=1 Tax=Zhongshania aquimaris TaxID=2857107 RepID=A0ABS6VVR7_9GAMM|nr:TIGR01777 family oxidoreductase [Zhongshania aquimaris]MBW2942376.1 TIGR01777 family oxidoreductase [Zhongshania aquimaris]